MNGNCSKLYKVESSAVTGGVGGYRYLSNATAHIKYRAIAFNPYFHVTIFRVQWNTRAIYNVGRHTAAD
jgi:hypothetical protein